MPKKIILHPKDSDKMKPRFSKHVCKSESNCQICRDYINKLDKYRQSISGGESNRKIIFRLARTSKLNKDNEVIRKFDLPNPRFIQTITT